MRVGSDGMFVFVNNTFTGSKMDSFRVLVETSFDPNVDINYIRSKLFRLQLENYKF